MDNVQVQQQPNQQADHPPIIVSGGLPALIQQAENGDAHEEALLALTNLAAHCDECREHLRAAGLLPLLLNLLESPAYQQQQPRAIVIRCLINVLHQDQLFVDQNHLVLDHATVCRLLAALEITIIAFGSGDIVCDAVRSLTWLIDGLDRDFFLVGIERVHLLLAHTELVRSIVAMLHSDSIPLLTSALELVATLSNGTDEQVTILLGFNVLRDILVLAKSDDHDIWSDSLEVLCNVAGRRENHNVTWMFAENGMEETLFQMSRSPNQEKRRAACVVLTNAMLNSSQAIYERLLNHGMARILMQRLDEVDDNELSHWFNINGTLEAMRQELEDRPESRDRSMAEFRRAGMVERLQFIAKQTVENPQSNAEIWQDMNAELATSILRRFFPVPFLRRILNRFFGVH